MSEAANGLEVPQLGYFRAWSGRTCPPCTDASFRTGKL